MTASPVETELLPCQNLNIHRFLLSLLVCDRFWAPVEVESDRRLPADILFYESKYNNTVAWITACLSLLCKYYCIRREKWKPVRIKSIFIVVTTVWIKMLPCQTTPTFFCGMRPNEESWKLKCRTAGPILLKYNFCACVLLSVFMCVNNTAGQSVGTSHTPIMLLTEQPLHLPLCQVWSV